MRGNHQVPIVIDIDANRGRCGRDVPQQCRIRRVRNIKHLNPAGSIRHKGPVIADHHIISRSRGIKRSNQNRIQGISDIINQQPPRAVGNKDFSTIDLHIIGLAGGIHCIGQDRRAAVRGIHDIHPQNTGRHVSRVAVHIHIRDRSREIQKRQRDGIKIFDHTGSLRGKPVIGDGDRAGSGGRGKDFTIRAAKIANRQVA